MDKLDTVLQAEHLKSVGDFVLTVCQSQFAFLQDAPIERAEIGPYQEVISNSINLRFERTKPNVNCRM